MPPHALGLGENPPSRRFETQPKHCCRRVRVAGLREIRHALHLETQSRMFGNLRTPDATVTAAESTNVTAKSSPARRAPTAADGTLNSGNKFSATNTSISVNIAVGYTLPSTQKEAVITVISCPSLVA
jgi:hypothetical protein